MDTLIANIKHAIRNRETVSIGGGEFSPSELKEAVSALEAAQQQAAALQEIANMLATLPEAEVGNSKVHYCLQKARNALRAAQ